MIEENTNPQPFTPQADDRTIHVHVYAGGHEIEHDEYLPAHLYQLRLSLHIATLKPVYQIAETQYFVCRHGVPV